MEAKKDLYLDAAQKHYQEYKDNILAISFDGAIFSNDDQNIYTLRSQGRGVQSIVKYQDTLDPVTTVMNSDNKKVKKRRWRINWKPVRLLSKFRGIAIQKMMDLILIPNTRAVDETARVEKRFMSTKMKLVRNPNSKVVLPTKDEFPEIETPEDVDFIDNLGGLRLPIEIMMKDAIDVTNYKSGVTEMKRMWAEDIIDINAMAAHQHNINGEERIEYVDPARILVRPSIYSDFRDSDFRGFLSNKTAKQIINEGDFQDEKIIQQIEALDVKGSHISDAKNVLGRREYFSNSTGTNDYGIEVLTLYYIERVVQRFIDGKRKDGVTQWEEVAADFELSKRAKKAGKTIKEVPTFVLKRCKWIVDTDIVYDTGIVQYTVREGQSGNKSIVWPITIYCGHEPSLISRCIEHDDDLQIANYTMRNIFSKIPPAPRMLIFSNYIKDQVDIGNNSYTLLDMFENYQAEGFMILEGDDYEVEPGEHRTQMPDPIRFMQTGVGEDLIQLRERMMQSIEFIRQATGINEIADGTSQNKDMLKSVMEGLTSATNSALKVYIDLYINGFTGIIKYTGMKYKMMALNGELELGNLPISSSIMKHIKLSQKVSDHDWGIMIEVVSPEAKRELIMDLQQRKDQLEPMLIFISGTSLIPEI
jgi:hypothetical protein